jgi:hypothetical protein
MAASSGIHELKRALNFAISCQVLQDAHFPEHLVRHVHTRESARFLRVSGD